VQVQIKHAYHRLIEAEIIDPTRVPPAQREVIFRRLYRVHQQIFAGVSIESFITYLVRPDGRALIGRSSDSGSLRTKVNETVRYG
jgi:hypothetical protein